MSLPITILGGGLCGLALANGLRLAGVPVKVIEAGHYPRHRVCGEFLAGLSDSTLQRLGLADCFQGAVRHSTTLWFRRGRPIRGYRLPQPALGLSRLALDARMAEVLRDRGGTVLTGVRAESSAVDGVVDARGRPPAAGGWYGGKGHWGDLPTGAGLELHLGRAAYVGLSAIETGDCNVCGLFRSVAAGAFPSPLERFYGTLQQHGLGYLADRLRGATHREGSLCSVSGLDYAPARLQGPVRLGDRWRLIPPFTGNGMTLAIESAAAVLPEAITYAEAGCSWEQFRARSDARLQELFGQRLRTARLLHPFLTHPALQMLLATAARLDMLPFRKLYNLTHG